MTPVSREITKRCDKTVTTKQEKTPEGEEESRSVNDKEEKKGKVLKFKIGRYHNAIKRQHKVSS